MKEMLFVMCTKNDSKLIWTLVILVLLTFSFAACSPNVIDSSYHEHSWDDGIITIPMTCTTQGEKVFTCQLCNEKRFEIIPASHSWGNTNVVIPATCLSNGMVTYECSICHAQKNETVQALGHKWVDIEIISAVTCKNSGLKKSKCSVCSTLQNVYIPSLGGEHVFINYHCTKCDLVGGVGPAKGFVFYDKGDYSEGWRYLEAAPADMKVINNKPTVDRTIEGYMTVPSNLGISLFNVGSYVINNEAVFTNGSTHYDNECTKTAIGTGKSNTTKLLNVLNTTSYMDATKLCDALEYGDYSDWFLPSKDELTLLYRNLHLEGLGGFGTTDSYGDYLSSSECSDNVYAVHGLRFYDRWEFKSGRGTEGGGGMQVVRPIRAF
ncbi:MAG: hypothetical protein WCS35_02240 [Sphaerochaeta sp.]